MRDLLDDAAKLSGVSRDQAFDDFLQMSVCAFSGGRMEEEYLVAVQKHAHGEQGQRGCDRIAEALAQVVLIMERTRADVLGDLLQGAISHGNAGQYFTPQPVCDLMARLTIDEAEQDSQEPRTVCDPCCGSGRMLLAAAKLRPHWRFVGQDIDLRCVRITALNLALNNLYGWVLWGDSLKNERRLAYRTGFDGRGFVCEAPVDECPLPAEPPELQNAGQSPSKTRKHNSPQHRQLGQLFLFD